MRQSGWAVYRIRFERIYDQGIPKKVNRPNVRFHHKNIMDVEFSPPASFMTTCSLLVRDAGGTGDPPYAYQRVSVAALRGRINTLSNNQNRFFPQPLCYWYALTFGLACSLVAWVVFGLE